MIALVESNFLLELVLRQEEVTAAEAMLESAESGQFRLAIPASALIEPIYAIEGKRQKRDTVVRSLMEESKQIGRSDHQRVFAGELSGTIGKFERLYTSNVIAYRSAIVRLLKVALVIPLEPSQLAAFSTLAEEYDLKGFDAVMLAALQSLISEFPEESDFFFITRDKGDFGKPEMAQRYTDRKCKHFNSYQHFLQYLASRSTNP